MRRKTPQDPAEAEARQRCQEIEEQLKVNEREFKQQEREAKAAAQLLYAERMRIATDERERKDEQLRAALEEVRRKCGRR